MPGPCNAALSTSLEPPFRQGGANLANYKHSIYDASSSSEHRADFQENRLNARGLHLGGSRKPLANKAWGLDIDAAPRQILGGLTSTTPSPNTWGLHDMQLHHQRHGRLVVTNKSASVAQPPCCQQQVRGTTIMLSARRSPSWYGHLAVKFLSKPYLQC